MSQVAYTFARASAREWLHLMRVAARRTFTATRRPRCRAHESRRPAPFVYRKFNSSMRRREPRCADFTDRTASALQRPALDEKPASSQHGLTLLTARGRGRGAEDGTRSKGGSPHFITWFNCRAGSRRGHTTRNGAISQRPAVHRVRATERERPTGPLRTQFLGTERPRGTDAPRSGFSTKGSFNVTFANYAPQDGRVRRPRDT